MVALVSIILAVLLGPQMSGAQTNCVRMATAKDVADMQQLHGITLPVGTCLDSTVTQTLGLDTGALQAQKFLEANVCPGKVVGYDPLMDPALLKETRVYFSALQTSVDTKFLVCAANFVATAQAAGFAPCVNAALRTQAHQRASCMDPGNSVVCGRTSSNPLQCRADLSSCPHVDGKGIDLNSLNGKILKIVTLANSGSFGVQMGVNNAYDPWHMTPAAACTDTTKLSDAAAAQNKSALSQASAGEPYSYDTTLYPSYQPRSHTSLSNLPSNIASNILMQYALSLGQSVITGNTSSGNTSRVSAVNTIPTGIIGASPTYLIMDPQAWPASPATGNRPTLTQLATDYQATLRADNFAQENVSAKILASITSSTQSPNLNALPKASTSVTPQASASTSAGTTSPQMSAEVRTKLIALYQQLVQVLTVMLSYLVALRK